MGHNTLANTKYVISLIFVSLTLSKKTMMSHNVGGRLWDTTPLQIQSISLANLATELLFFCTKGVPLRRD